MDEGPEVRVSVDGRELGLFDGVVWEKANGVQAFSSDRRPAHRIARCCTFRYAHEFLTMLYLLGWVVRDGR